MNDVSTQLQVIPTLRKVYKDTKANLDALTGLRDEDLAYGTDTEVLYRQNGAGAANWESITTVTIYPELAVKHMRLIAAYGNCTTPGNANDNVLANVAVFLAVDQYVEILLPGIFEITQFRYYGDANMNEDGYYKIQYKDLTGSWVDWVTGLPTNLAAWTTWDSTGGAVYASAIRFIATTLDSWGGGSSRLGELEVKY